MEPAPFTETDVAEDGPGVRVNGQREKEQSTRARSRRTPGPFYLQYNKFRITWRGDECGRLLRLPILRLTFTFLNSLT
jgi:hypothetical protein